MQPNFCFAAVVASLAAAAFANNAHAQTSFTFHRLDVTGNKDIDATAINDRGQITAALFDTTNNTQSGIILHKGVATTLPAPYANSGAPIPAAINEHGDVLGYTYEGYQPVMFLWHAGQYLQDADIPLEIEQQAGPPPLPIGLNNRDEVFYTIITGQQNPTDPIYGKLSHLRSMHPFLRYQTAHSNNAQGLIAGTSFYDSQSEVFVGRGKAFSILLPTGAVSAEGGFVNDKGEVAGAYTDSSNIQHGFTWQNGSYTSFDLPEAAQPYSLTVTGLNNAGRVVGTYTSSATNHVHAFLYNGADVTAFGDFKVGDTVAVALNNSGTMIVADQIHGEATNYASYRVRCRGAGC
jgi:probable HAF family extracellular repeat protein